MKKIQYVATALTYSMVLFAFLPPSPFIGEWGIIFIGIYTMPVAMMISVFQSVLITEKALH